MNGGVRPCLPSSTHVAPRRRRTEERIRPPEAFARLGLGDEARQHFGQVHMLCGDPTQLAQSFGPIWLQLLSEARSIAGLIALTPFQRLGGARVIDVVPPYLSAEAQQAEKVKDVLLAGDESCVKDAEVSRAEGIGDVPAHTAVAGLRLAFDSVSDFGLSRSLWVRFRCLMQLLTRGAIVVR